jgi:hypothetical protein
MSSGFQSGIYDIARASRLWVRHLQASPFVFGPLVAGHLLFGLLRFDPLLLALLLSGFLAIELFILIGALAFDKFPLW